VDKNSASKLDKVKSNLGINKNKKVKRTKSTFNNDNKTTSTNSGMMIIYEKPKPRKKSPKLTNKKRIIS
jgi:hypothetical protein